MKKSSDSRILRLTGRAGTIHFHTLHDEVWNRENKVPGIRKNCYLDSQVLLIGAGGLGGMIGLGLMRKGISKLTICDGDAVEFSNLNRQRFFYSDVENPKAFALARNLQPEALTHTQLTGVALYFEESLQILKRHRLSDPNIVICCPDNDEVREFTSNWCAEDCIPLVVTGLSNDSDYGYVMVQLPSSQSGCWHCLRKGNRGRAECGVAANINLVLLVSGLVLQACDWILSGATPPWNYRRVSLSGQLTDLSTVVQKWPQCPTCSLTVRKKVVAEQG